eukprot:g4112.t1
MALKPNLNPRLVPWASWREWLDVYSQLFSRNIAWKREGIDNVQVWRARGNVPLAVEATSQLVLAELALLEYAENSSGASNGAFRSMDTNAPYHNERSEMELRLLAS